MFLPALDEKRLRRAYKSACGGLIESPAAG
jgi:hypothetical protein